MCNVAFRVDTVAVEANEFFFDLFNVIINGKSAHEMSVAKRTL